VEIHPNYINNHTDSLFRAHKQRG